MAKKKRPGKSPNKNRIQKHLPEESGSEAAREAGDDETHVYNPKKSAIAQQLAELQRQMEHEIANEEHVRAALQRFLEYYNNSEFEELEALLTEKPKATFIGTGDKEFITGRENILDHWKQEPRDETLALSIGGATEFGFHGDVVCLVTRLNLCNRVSGEVLCELRLSGYVVCENDIWRWASIHLSTPDPSQDEDQQYGSGYEPKRSIEFDPFTLPECVNVHGNGGTPANADSGVGSHDFEQLIVTATHIERDAVLQKMGPPKSKSKILKHTLNNEQELFLGTLGNFGVIVTQCPEETVGEDLSEVAFYRVLDFWKPRALVMFGRAILNPRFSRTAGDFLVAPQLRQLGVRNCESQFADFIDVKLQQPDLEAILNLRRGSDDDFDERCVGPLVACPNVTHTQMPIRRLKHEIFHKHRDDRGLLIEGASACVAAARRGMNWMLLADILDINPDDDRQDNIWRSATRAASLLKDISIGKTPWWDVGNFGVEDKVNTSVKNFDVFMCHNTEDKQAVRAIAEQLKSRHKLRPWLDEWELRPGLPWMQQINEAFNNVKAVAVCVGSNEIGPWQNDEVTIFLKEAKENGLPVIPVIFPDAPEGKVEIPPFLNVNQMVDFRVSEPDPLDQLYWGITGVRVPSNDD